MYRCTEHTLITDYDAQCFNRRKISLEFFLLVFFFSKDQDMFKKLQLLEYFRMHKLIILQKL